MRINYKGESKIIERLCNGVNRLEEDYEAICEKVGEMEQLTTEDKSSLVAAVNEVRGMVDGVLGGLS